VDNKSDKIMQKSKMMKDRPSISPTRQSEQTRAMSEGRADRFSRWPEEVRGARVFKSFVCLKYEGREYHLEIRSRKNGKFYAMDDDNGLATGDSRLQVQARYIQLIDPDVVVAVAAYSCEVQQRGTGPTQQRRLRKIAGVGSTCSTSDRRGKRSRDRNLDRGNDGVGSCGSRSIAGNSDRIEEKRKELGRA
jgi:hypothetical protein